MGVTNLTLNQVLAKIDSWSTTILLSLFFIFMLSGYMITRGWIDRAWGLILHTELDLPIMAVFTLHFTTRIRFYLLRKKITKGSMLNMITLLIAAISFGFILYLDLFFQLS